MYTVLRVTLLLSLLATATRAQDITTGLTGHWKLDGNYTDSAGTADTGTPSNSPTFTTTGRIGTGTNALVCDGQNDFVTIANQATYDFDNTAFTVALWVRRAVGSGNGKALFGKYNYFATISTGNLVVAELWDSAGSSLVYRRRSVAAIPENVWTHVVIVFTTTTGASTEGISIYVNGVLSNGTINDAGASFNYGSNNAALALCAWEAAATALPFPGGLDDVRVYSRALTANDVTALYNTGAPTPLTLNVTGSGAVTSSPAGIDCPDVACMANFDLNSSVTLTATAAADHAFAGWGGQCSAEGTTSPITVSMTTATACTATFAPSTTTLTITAITGNGTVMSSPAGVSCTGVDGVLSGDCHEPYSGSPSVTITGTAASGWTFSAFGGDADCTDGTVSLSAAKNCTATFTGQFAPQSMSGTVSGTATTLTVPTDTQTGWVIDVARITATTEAVCYTYDGTTPTASCATSGVGHYLPAGDTALIFGQANVARIKLVAVTSTANYRVTWDILP